MQIHCKCRHTEIDPGFRELAEHKLARVGKLDPRLVRIEVELSRETNPRLARQSERVALSAFSAGPVVRAQAAAQDAASAFDLALDKLENRLRRSADRRRIHHGARSPVSVAAATAQPARR
jgi:ribosomal subunit interface protein